MIDVEKTALALVLSLPSLAAVLITWEHLVQPLPKIAFLCSFQYSYFYPIKLYDPEPEMTKYLSWCHLHIVTILSLLIFFFLMYFLWSQCPLGWFLIWILEPQHRAMLGCCNLDARSLYSGGIPEANALFVRHVSLKLPLLYNHLYCQLLVVS